MKIGDVITIDEVEYRVIEDGTTHFCLNDLSKGGYIRNYGWKQWKLPSLGIEKLVAFDVREFKRR